MLLVSVAALSGAAPAGHTNGALDALQRAAFAAGVPVLPVLLTYRFRHLDPAAPATGLGANAVRTWRLLSQVRELQENAC